MVKAELLKAKSQVGLIFDPSSQRLMTMYDLACDTCFVAMPLIIRGESTSEVKTGGNEPSERDEMDT